MYLLSFIFDRDRGSAKKSKPTPSLSEVQKKCNNHQLLAEEDANGNQCDAGCKRLICSNCTLLCTRCDESFCDYCAGPNEDSIIRCKACMIADDEDEQYDVWLMRLEE